MHLNFSHISVCYNVFVKLHFIDAKNVAYDATIAEERYKELVPLELYAIIDKPDT